VGVWRAWRYRICLATHTLRSSVHTFLAVPIHLQCISSDDTSNVCDAGERADSATSRMQWQGDIAIREATEPRSSGCCKRQLAIARCRPCQSTGCRRLELLCGQRNAHFTSYL
jgi:hypothetical protein